MPSEIAGEIKLEIGKSTSVKLKGLATAGYTWNYTTDDDKNCISISKEFSEPGNSKQKMGANADEVFTITAYKKGIVHIHFSQQRSWEKNKVLVNDKNLTIIIE